MTVTKIPRLRFAASLASYVLLGGLRFPGGHRPPVNHRVPEAFPGVGIAAAEEPSVDDWLIARLRDNGIRHVRLDFTYGDSMRPAGRLLERLLGESLHVTLHLVPPAARVRHIESDDEARREWRQFVVETLDHFGARVEIIEIGSTVNRQRWSGLSLAGFLVLWDIAWREVRERGFMLAGPSVTDFEPPWNIGLLALLKNRGQLPDFHTDNLFSERCTEPERYDQKILGRRLAALHKYNLIKKARLLARIGADYGVPRLLSPSAFWTLPRIERLLPDSEQKQADYLARYMVLCAASGALERAWWGPLVCHREGLIDEGNFSYPALERITHYAGVRGQISDLRTRPALLALGAFAEQIPGGHYRGRLARSDRLEIHAFQTDAGLVHVAWTTNGHAAALSDIYRGEDLRLARFRGRDGNILSEPPTLVSESPIYLWWAPGAAVTVREHAAVLDGVAIHRHQPDRTHYFFCEDGWRGLVLARDAGEAAMLLQALHPAHLQAPPREGALRHARNAIWTLPDPRADGKKLVVKQPVKMHLHKKLLDRFKPSKGLRSWNGTSELLRRGVNAAMPVAWFEKQGDRTLMQNFYICEYVPAEWTARDMISAFSAGEKSFAGVAEETAYAQLSAYLLRMHGGGVLFRDLSAGNILIRKTGDACFDFALIDTGRIRIFNGPLTLMQRFSDLVRICNKLHAEGREKFLKCYLGAIGRHVRIWHRLPFMGYDLKVWAKRRFGRKAIKRLFDRR